MPIAGIAYVIVLFATGFNAAAVIIGVEPGADHNDGCAHCCRSNCSRSSARARRSAWTAGHDVTTHLLGRVEAGSRTACHVLIQSGTGRRIPLRHERIVTVLADSCPRDAHLETCHCAVTGDAWSRWRVPDVWVTAGPRRGVVDARRASVGAGSVVSSAASSSSQGLTCSSAGPECHHLAGPSSLGIVARDRHSGSSLWRGRWPPGHRGAGRRCCAR